MAVGAALVLERSGRTDVIVVGFDGIPEGVELVKQGKAAGDVAQNAKVMGEKSVEIAIELIKGQKQPGDYPDSIDSGMLLVHQWNVQEYEKEFMGGAQ